MARCRYDYNRGRRYCQRNAWDNWVRWVVLVVIVVGFFLLFVLCSCLTARRRRKAGRQPYYGTGWMAKNGQYNNNQHSAPYYNNQYDTQQPAPPYSPPAQTQTQTQSYGYYGQQTGGVELQSPQPAYHNPGSENVYAPPPGPPPGKV